MSVMSPQVLLYVIGIYRCHQYHAVRHVRHIIEPVNMSSILLTGQEEEEEEEEDCMVAVSSAVTYYDDTT